MSNDANESARFSYVYIQNNNQHKTIKRMNRHYHQPATTIAAVYLQVRILDVSPESGLDGVSAVRSSYTPRPEAVWGN